MKLDFSLYVRRNYLITTPTKDGRHLGFHSAPITAEHSEMWHTNTTAIVDNEGNDNFSKFRIEWAM